MASYTFSIPSLRLCLGLLCGTFVFSQAIASEIPFDTSTRESYGLVGPVREVVQRSTHWREGAPTSVTRTLFDPRGNVLEVSEWEEAGGALTSPSTLKLRYEYDSSGHLLKRFTYKKDGTVSITAIYSYDEKGNRARELFHDEEGRQTSLGLYTWDATGKLREFRTYGRNGHLFPDGDLGSRWTWEYDDKGRQTEIHQYRGDGHKTDGFLFKIIVNKFNEIGQIVESKALKGDSSLDRRYVYRFDKAGQKVEELTYTPEGKLSFRTTETYEYDDRGNWIKRKPGRWFYNKSEKPEQWPTESYVRTITYY